MIPSSVTSGATDGDRHLVEARLRIERFLDELDHIGIEDIALVSLPAGDVPARAHARAAAVAAASYAGLGQVLRESREQARARIVRMYDRNMYQPTWAGLNWGRSLGTVEDRVAVSAAVEDAAIATVALGLIPADQAGELLEPMRLVVAMHSRDTYRGQFAGTGWTAWTGVGLFLIFVAYWVAIIGAIFGPVGWLVTLAIVIASGILIRRDRST